MNATAGRILWAVAAPLAVLAFLAAVFAAWLLVPGRVAPDASLFLSWARPFCRPEPREQLGYVLAVLAVPVVFWLCAAYARRAAAGGPGVWDSRPVRIWATAAQWLLFGFAVAAFVYQETRGAPYFQLWSKLFNKLLLSLALLGMSWRFAAAARPAAAAPPAPAGRRARLRRAAWAAVPAAVAVALTAAELLPSVVWPHREPACEGVGLWHLSYQFGEFAAFQGGRTPLVDFFPQYQYLLCYLLAPAFAAAGLSYSTFTFVMALLSAGALLAFFAAFRRFTGDAWKALALFLPLLWVGCTPLARDQAGEYEVRYGAFTYFAVGPLRYLGPCLTLLALVWFLGRPGRARALALFFTAGLAAVNNLDFGAPAFAAAVLAVLFSGAGGPLPGWRAVGRTLAAAAAGAAAAVAAFLLLTWARAGRPPDWRMAACFPRAFAVNGFYMLPMPSFGLHWVMFLTFMAALARALFDGGLSRLRKGLLLFGGVFGPGAMMYYVGRSHPQVLGMIFLAWAFPLLLLVWVTWEDALARARAHGPWRAFTPAALLLSLGYAALADQGELSPSLGEQFKRLTKRVPEEFPHDPFQAERTAVEAAVRSYARPGEAVAILSSCGHPVAVKAGVRNVFPFTGDQSLILRSQLDLFLRTVDDGGVRLVFGPGPSEELGQELARRGFHRRGEGHGTVWVRDRRPPEAPGDGRPPVFRAPGFEPSERAGAE
jgi:hypothetical protein